MTITIIKQKIKLAEKKKDWKIWQKLNDELERVEDEVENKAKLKLAQKKWDGMNLSQKKKYPKRPKTLRDIIKKL